MESDMRVLDRRQDTTEREQLERDIADAWANVEHDISYAKHAMWTSEADLKLLKWAMGVK